MHEEFEVWFKEVNKPKMSFIQVGICNFIRPEIEIFTKFSCFTNITKDLSDISIVSNINQ